MKKSVLLTLTLLFTLLSSVFAFATTPTTAPTNDTTTSYSTGTVNGTTTTTTADTTNGGFGTVNVDGGLPNVTIDQANAWVQEKGYDVVGLLQTAVQPFAVIVFIICAFLTLLGSFGNSQLTGRGIFGMFIAVLMYAVVLYAPELMDFVLTWLKA